MQLEKPRPGLAKARSDAMPRRVASRGALMRAKSTFARPGAALFIARSIRNRLRPANRRRSAQNVLRPCCVALLVGFIAGFLLFGGPGKIEVSGKREEDVGKEEIKEKIEAIRLQMQRERLPKFAKISVKPRRRQWKGRLRRLGKGLVRRNGVKDVELVKLSGRVERVHVGTYLDVRRVGVTTMHMVPAEAVRFNVPWLLLPRVETLPLSRSGWRVLHSTIRELSSDGLGHGMTVVNAELSTALNLGLTYTHRVGMYGSVSRRRPEAVEEMFGWGVGEIGRDWVERELCVVRRVSNFGKDVGMEMCPVCERVRDEAGMERIVTVPVGLSYGCVSCTPRQKAVKKFLRAFGRNRTVYEMDAARCDASPKSPDFALSRGYFYWKYWDAHADGRWGRVERMEGKGAPVGADVTRRRPVELDERELVIAVHARRGDFFQEKGRRMVGANVFVKVLLQVMEAVGVVGGVFAKMQVRVMVYSEGRRLKGVSGLSHDDGLSDHVFVDIDGQVRDGEWWLGLLLPKNDTRHTFRNGVKVEMCVGGHVERAFHDMVSADIFLGSASDLSQYAVRVIARAGLVLLPDYGGGVPGCCVLRFGPHGRVRHHRWMVDMWRRYVFANQHSARRAFTHIHPPHPHP